MIKIEDAIANLKNQIMRFGKGTEPDLALQMAIKALEQESKSEWEHDHEILKAYSDGASDILDKIRAEIEQEPYVSKMEVLEIIDKYKAESEEGAEKFVCDNNGDCEHCEWTTCPEMEGAEE